MEESIFGDDAETSGSVVDLNKATAEWALVPQEPQRLPQMALGPHAVFVPVLESLQALRRLVFEKGPPPVMLVITCSERDDFVGCGVLWEVASGSSGNAFRGPGNTWFTVRRVGADVNQAFNDHFVKRS